LRLYSARASDEFDMQIFNAGDYIRAAEEKMRSETISKVLYPSDMAIAGRELRDGQTLFGWKAHSKADWEVKNGAIAVSGGEKGLLCTTVGFDNYVLKVDFRAAKDTNSGVFLRTPPVLGPDDVKSKCYELNIAPPENPFPTGGYVSRQKGKAVPERAGEWQSFEVTLDGAKSTVKLNGETVMEYTDPAPVGRGLIGLQLNTGAVEFKNIDMLTHELMDVKDLCDILFNAKISDLVGIKRVPASSDDNNGTDFLTDKKASTNEFVVVTPYELRFQGFSSELARVLERMIAAKRCFVVRNVAVDKASTAAAEARSWRSCSGR
jgi:hypothetical protein